MQQMRLRHLCAAVIFGGLFVALFGGASSLASPTTHRAGPYQVAWVMVLQNDYTQAMLKGAQAAAKSENVKITPFDTGFSPQKQFSVIQDVISLHKYQGI